MSKEHKSITKELRKEIAEQLEKSLPHLKALLGEKKFSNRVKKAAKILGEDVVVEEVKVKAAPKAAQSEKVKKATPVKAQPVAPKAPAKPKAAVKKSSRPAPAKKKAVVSEKA